MGVNSLPKTVTRQRRGCDLNPGPSAPESSTLTTRLPSHPLVIVIVMEINKETVVIKSHTVMPSLFSSPSHIILTHPLSTDACERIWEIG